MHVSEIIPFLAILGAKMPAMRGVFGREFIAGAEHKPAYRVS
jgi:hypothetical protein